MSASNTALGVAAVLVFLGREERYAGMLPPGAAELTGRLLEVGPGWLRGVLRVMRWRFVRRLCWWRDRLGNPGLVVHLGLRKRWVDDQVRAALAAGAEQVAVLGAGFDTLCARLAAAHPDRRFLEVDRPATQALKRRGLDHAGIARDNLHLVPLDLAAATLADTLGAHPAWRSGALSVVVAEGLTMYLDDAAVDELLLFFRSGTGRGSRFVFSFIEKDARGRLWTGRFGGYLRLRLRLAGEPMRFGIPRGGLGEFLEKRGLVALDAPDRDELRRRYDLAGTPLLGWELLAVAGHAPVG